MSERYEDLAVITNTLDMGRAPIGVRVQKDRETGTLSFEFGRMVSGKLEPVRYWKEDNLIYLSSLSKLAATLHILPILGGTQVTAEMLRTHLKNSVFKVQEEALTSHQQRQSEKNRKFGATIGERTGKK
jgi:hypothetical protein